ncbi:MAG: glycine--tRNA ligase subunit beta [Nitrospiraceae bacterium]|nr:MAG: glycine--tRNA ligase subunit beta [Nitrospiraceae bacterium]
MAKPLLIEIGSEEIPARFVTRGLEILRGSLTEFLEKSSIDYGDIREYATPRRLALLVIDVAEEQRDKTIETLGPPKKAAYDALGNPTKAASGFARSLNIGVDTLKIVKTERGEYVAAVIEEKGRDTIGVLAGALPLIISSLQLPRSMRWSSSSLRYFRPIHWIVAVFGKEIIPFELEGMQSGRTSYGHRFLAPGDIRIDDPSSYPALLKTSHVIAESEKRKEMIRDGLRSIESSSGRTVHQDEELLDTVTNLVEYPTVVLGSFDEKYASLPKELLITVMRSHQKYFSLKERDGSIAPLFALVSNTKVENNDTVRRGAERVLRARLEDARFYYAEDRKQPLEAYCEGLKKVTFQDRLGSLHSKGERVAALCSFIAEKLGLAPVKEKLLRAATLSKADLVTGVVREFPELQGYMGMTYALDTGEDRDVAEAIFEHYLPRTAGDRLPSGVTGSVLSIADKMDTIASFFYLGKIPTGSEDPFALRRQAAGIMHILQENGFELPLGILADQSLKALEPAQEKRGMILESIIPFFRQRLEGIFLAQGHSHDIVSAALSADELDISAAHRSILVLSELKKAPAFPVLLMAARRVYNILVAVPPGSVREEMLADSSEKILFAAVREVSGKVADGHFMALFELEQPVNSFFEAVLVMDKDPAVKNNRLALLQSVKEVFQAVGDFSKIVD